MLKSKQAPTIIRAQDKPYPNKPKVPIQNNLIVLPTLAKAPKQDNAVNKAIMIRNIPVNILIGELECVLRVSMAPQNYFNIIKIFYHNKETDFNTKL